ncbi:hypothetical protein ACWDRB_47275 [Nonomuraea sp. NPDC003707]
MNYSQLADIIRAAQLDERGPHQHHAHISLNRIELCIRPGVGVGSLSRAYFEAIRPHLSPGWELEVVTYLGEPPHRTMTFSGRSAPTVEDTETLPPYVFELDVKEVDHLQHVYVRAHGLYAQVTAVRRYAHHAEVWWDAIGPLQAGQPRTGILMVCPGENVPIIRRADLALAFAQMGVDSGLWLPAPSGCRWCGVGQRLHGRWWAVGVGFHYWENPGDEVRKARMLARRGTATA